MNVLVPILAMGVGVYALRLAGLALPNVAVPTAWEEALRFVPVALLTSLIVLSLSSQTDESAIRFVAAVGAALVAYRTRRMWACILAGMVLYWILSLV